MSSLVSSEWLVAFTAMQMSLGTFRTKHWHPLTSVIRWMADRLLPRCKSIILSGRIVEMVDAYYSKANTASKFSDRFHAIWNYIVDRIPCNETIHELSENVLTTQATADEKPSFLFVSQQGQFEISPHIFAKTTISYDDEEKTTGQHGGNTKAMRTMHIEIKLFTYKLSLDALNKFVDNLTEHYLEKIRKSREKKTFLYTLYQTEYESDICDCWLENIFESNRTFDNLFFEGKVALMSQLDFFVHNQEWYNRMGIPYTLGIGLSGPPGTGKTSLIKCIANHLRRHVVSLSLKLIQTRMQLLQFFYENQYNIDNRPESIGFDKKIIVLEDIDCLGAIVKKRQTTTDDDDDECDDVMDRRKLTELLQDKLTKVQLDKVLSGCSKTANDAITLDDILNLWDGLCETPHRILIITSNHYDQLDPALVRPGRIDFTLNMGYVTMPVLREMFQHLFEKPWPDNTIVSPHVLKTHTPAKIINLFLQCGRDETRFLKGLHVKTLRRTLPSAPPLKKCLFSTDPLDSPSDNASS